MTHVPHQLTEEFPDKAGRIAEMEQSDAHFARLAKEYDEVNRVIHRAETNVEPMEDLAENDMRKKRAALKDEIYRMLTQAA